MNRLAALSIGSLLETYVNGANLDFSALSPEIRRELDSLADLIVRILQGKRKRISKAGWGVFSAVSAHPNEVKDTREARLSLHENVETGPLQQGYLREAVRQREPDLFASLAADDNRQVLARAWPGGVYYTLSDNNWMDRRIKLRASNSPMCEKTETPDSFEVLMEVLNEQLHTLWPAVTERLGASGTAQDNSVRTEDFWIEVRASHLEDGTVYLSARAWNFDFSPGQFKAIQQEGPNHFPHLPSLRISRSGDMALVFELELPRVVDYKAIVPTQRGLWVRGC